MFGGRERGLLLLADQLELYLINRSRCANILCSDEGLLLVLAHCHCSSTLQCRSPLILHFEIISFFEVQIVIIRILKLRNMHTIRQAVKQATLRLSTE